MTEVSIDNKPISIVLDSTESTTVPENETWRVSIHLANQEVTLMEIDGIGQWRGDRNMDSSPGNYLDCVLTGGQTIAEVFGQQFAAILITGFVVSD